MSNFEELADLLDSLKSESKRNSKIELVAEFLKKLEIEEINPAALFLSGRVFPENDSKTLNVSWAGVKNALGQVVELADREISKYYKGDMGEAVTALLESNVGPRQSTLFPTSITILRIRDDLDTLASTIGKGSKKRNNSYYNNTKQDGRKK